jgi:hypothetical protein
VFNSNKFFFSLKGVNLFIFLNINLYKNKSLGYEVMTQNVLILGTIRFFLNMKTNCNSSSISSSNIFNIQFHCQHFSNVNSSHFPNFKIPTNFFVPSKLNFFCSEESKEGEEMEI